MLDALLAIETTPEGIEAKLAAAVAAVESAKNNYGQIALDGEEGKVSAAVVSAADKALQTAKGRVRSLTAASAASQARAERQAAADAATAQEAAALAKRNALDVLRAKAATWDAAVQQLKAVTTEYEAAEDGFRKHTPTQTEHAQMNAVRADALAIIELELKHFLGEPKLDPFMSGDRLKLATHPIFIK